MARENAQAKGRRLLVEGRLVVEAVDNSKVIARCRGDSGEVYRLGWHPLRNEWACTCQARTSCSHLCALQLVTVSPGSEVEPIGPTGREAGA